jgi:hypothetical protein
MNLTKLALAAAAVTGLLTGCVIVNESYTGVSNSSKRDYLTYAGGKSPVLIRAVNSPFAEGALATAAVSARHAREAIFGSPVEFTEKPEAAAQSHFRVVMVFNPAVTVSDYDVCKADQTPPRVSQTPGELRIHSTFCSRDEPLAGTIVTGPAPSSLNDAAYTKMVEMAFNNMFPINDPEGPNERPFLTSLRLAPTIGFRLNPFEGLTN